MIILCSLYLIYIAHARRPISPGPAQALALPHSGLIEQGAAAYAAQRLRRHLEKTGHIDQGCAEDDLRRQFAKLAVALLCRLEAHEVGHDLRDHEALLQYLAKEDLYVHVVEGHLLQAMLGERIDIGGLQGLYLQMGVGSS